jgi:hypothetical protein
MTDEEKRQADWLWLHKFHGKKSKPPPPNPMTDEEFKEACRRAADAERKRLTGE